VGFNSAYSWMIDQTRRATLKLGYILIMSSSVVSLVVLLILWKKVWMLLLFQRIVELNPGIEQQWLCSDAGHDCRHLNQVHLSSNYIASHRSPTREGNETRSETHHEIKSNQSSRFFLFRRKLTGSELEVKYQSSNGVHV